MNYCCAEQVLRRGTMFHTFPISSSKLWMVRFDAQSNRRFQTSNDIDNRIRTEEVIQGITSGGKVGEVGEVGDKVGDETDFQPSR